SIHDVKRPGVNYPSPSSPRKRGPIIPGPSRDPCFLGPRWWRDLDRSPGAGTGVHHAMTVCTGTAPPPSLISAWLGLSDIANDHAAVIAVTAMINPMVMLLFI